jgi:hypothetical protein
MDKAVYDLETLTNCFIACFEDYKTEDQKVFVVHDLRNDFELFVEYLKFLKEKKGWLISFNGLGFDSQVIEFISQYYDEWKGKSGCEIANIIYRFAQRTINNQDQLPEYPEWKMSINQIDVFKLNHWDNPAKRSSLKWIQYSMDWHTIQDMPIKHTTEIKSMQQLQTVISYCKNDVKSTKAIMNLSKEQINLRKTLTKDYGINLFSASEPRISKELFLYFLSKETGISKFDLKQLRTFRNKIVVKDIILPYIKFQTPEFQRLLNQFNKLEINPNETKNSFKYTIRYKGVNTDFGLGGVHGAADSGIYESTEDMIIMSSDVTSFYPNLAIRNGWAPAHLPKREFCNLYEWFFEERKKIPKKDPKNYVYKIILNSTYGLSNDKNSFLYDPEFTMRITINGQLSLVMLYEMLAEGIPGSVPLMQNTDGLEMMIPKQYKQKYLDICAEWEKTTKLQLEHDEYKKMILADVNNYIAINTAGKSKCKGRFEFSDLALHKNKSFLIIPKAIYNYFVNDIPPEKYLADNRNIFDYCGGVKIKGDWEFVQTCVKNGEVTYEKLQPTLRYYVSEKGCKIVKRNIHDKREIQLESGRWMQELFINYEKKDWKDYHVDDRYYLEAIEKEINNIIKPVRQLTLF